MDLLPKPSFIDRLKIHFGRYWKHMLVAVVSGVAISLMAYTLVLQGIIFNGSGDNARLAQRKETTTASPLTGLRVSFADAERPVTGVMIENSPDARPQSGLASAGIVFETVAEGGITRYLALFQEAKPKEIGPVRSLRPYYLDWAMGFDANIAHAGGSGDALELAKQRHAKSMNGLIYGQGYQRTGDRAAPHNLYTSASKLDGLAKELDFKHPSKFTPYTRVSRETPSATPNRKSIKVSFSGPLYSTEFRYRKSSNTYLRYLTGAPDKDRANGHQIAVKNVVLMPLNITNDGQYAQIRTRGHGGVIVFRDGIAIKGTWKKDTGSGQLQLVDRQDRPIPLNPGSTWFLVAPTSGTIRY